MKVLPSPCVSLSIVFNIGGNSFPFVSSQLNLNEKLSEIYFLLGLHSGWLQRYFCFWQRHVRCQGTVQNSFIHSFLHTWCYMIDTLPILVLTSNTLKLFSFGNSQESWFVVKSRCAARFSR